MKIFKVSGYLLEEDNRTNSEEMRTWLEETSNPRQLHIEEATVEDKTADDFPENIDLADLEKYFDHRPYHYEGDRELPREGEIWKHFKGNSVEIIGISQDTEYSNHSVVYNYNGRLFNRPLDMFMSEVDHVKYPDVKRKYRFERAACRKVVADREVCFKCKEKWLDDEVEE